MGDFPVPQLAAHRLDLLLLPASHTRLRREDDPALLPSWGVLPGDEAAEFGVPRLSILLDGFHGEVALPLGQPELLWAHAA